MSLPPVSGILLSPLCVEHCLGECLFEFFDGLKTILGRFFEALHDDGLQRCRDVRLNLRWGDRLLIGVREDDPQRRIPFEDGSPGQQMIGGCAERIDVAAGVEFTVSDAALGRRVQRRTNENR